MISIVHERFPKLDVTAEIEACADPDALRAIISKITGARTPAAVKRLLLTLHKQRQDN